MCRTINMVFLNVRKSSYIGEDEGGSFDERTANAEEVPESGARQVAGGQTNRQEVSQSAQYSTIKTWKVETIKLFSLGEHHIEAHDVLTMCMTECRHRKVDIITFLNS